MQPHLTSWRSATIPVLSSIKDNLRYKGTGKTQRHCPVQISICGDSVLQCLLETYANLRSPTAWVSHAWREALQVFQVYFQDMRDNLRHVMQYKCLASTTSSYVFALFWPWGLHAHSNISKHGMCLEIRQRTQLVGCQENTGQVCRSTNFFFCITSSTDLTTW